MLAGDDDHDENNDDDGAAPIYGVLLGGGHRMADLRMSLSGASPTNNGTKRSKSPKRFELPLEKERKKKQAAASNSKRERKVSCSFVKDFRTDYPKPNRIEKGG